MDHVGLRLLSQTDLNEKNVSDPKTNKTFNDNFVLSWNNICLRRTKKKSGFLKRSKYENIQILNNVSGVIKSGKLMAVMGPSGSGKTTLIAAISMRIQGNFTGSLRLNGRDATKQFLTSISGFVPQYDLAFESLTVFEHMSFMAKMKMDKRLKDEERKKRIVDLLHELGLNKCHYTKLSSLSGGERKRLSLAVQLINNPPLLFCDEPTTGLDSWAAASVVKQLRTLASSGKAIICSIHQPASGIFDLFQEVLILAGGNVAYRGPVNEAVPFFKTQEFYCPIGFNEAEFLVSVISEEKSARKICMAWTNEEADVRNMKRLSEEIENFNNPDLMDHEVWKLNGHSVNQPGKFIQFYWLLWRTCISAKRDNKILLTEFLMLMGIALILAIPYINVLEKVEQSDIQNVQGLLYLIVCEIIFMSLYSVFMAFPSEISIFLRETANGLYTPAPYYLSKIIFLLPTTIMESFLYSTIIFWVVGLRGESYGFLLFIIPVIFSANCATAYGAFLSATFESITTASLVSVPIDLVTCIYSGVFLNLSSLPLSIWWIKYLSIFFYSTEAVSISQWERVDKLNCDERAGLPCIKTGVEVIDVLGYGAGNYSNDLAGMVIMYCAFHVFGFISLLRRSKRQPVY